MTKLRSRLRRHLSLANLLSVTALFVALGGVSYAATTINGNKIVKQSIGAGKLKKGTLTSTQVKADALTGSVIDESTLSIVPAAQAAVTAQSATTATTAQSAQTATSAATAQSADTATEAETLAGLTPEELEVSCPQGTTLFGGVCWDDQERPVKTWIGASVECGEAGGRLPTLSELIAYVLRDGTQASTPHWSDDVLELSGGLPVVLLRDETTTSSQEANGFTAGFRCVFYRAN